MTMLYPFLLGGSEVHSYEQDRVSSDGRTTQILRTLELHVGSKVPAIPTQISLFLARYEYHVHQSHAQGM